MPDPVTANALAENVLLPLIEGGKLCPLEPIGPTRAAAFAHAEALTVSGGAMDSVRAHRVRAARRVAGIDALGDLSAGEWLLACALNDLVQVTNPTLTGWFDKDRPRKLAELVAAQVNSAGPPRRISEALARFATFGRILTVGRVDTTVTWWVGSETFRGLEPPARLLRWRGLRRVRTKQQRVSIGNMAPEGFDGRGYEDALGLFLRANPLTDLATAARKRAPFAWSGASLALISTGLGRNLARRAIYRAQDVPQTLQALSRACAQVQHTPAQELVDGFYSELGAVERAQAEGAS